jgi:protein-disulfide isomerase
MAEGISTEIDKLKSMNKALIVGLVILSFFLGSLTNKLATLKSGTAENPSQQAAAPQQATTITIDKIKALFDGKNLTLGDKNSKNLFVEISDPSCPYCSIASGQNPELNKQAGSQFLTAADGGTYVPAVPEIKKLVDQGKAAFVYIYYPGHGSGELGAKALSCANEKGKFWEVHDKLMSDSGYNLLNNTIKNDLTKSQELADFLADTFDSATMKSCLDSGKYDARIAENTATANTLGINGTPGFIINTSVFTGAYSWKDMESSVK